MVISCRITTHHSHTTFVFVEMSGKSNAKTVQGTNDSSIVSKHAMVEAGYLSDPYLQIFTLRNAPRRAPLINRGYYVRSKAIDSIIHSFLLLQGPKQIVSLGAGFDTTYLRLSTSVELQHRMRDVYFVEVDFPEVVQRKKDLISASDVDSTVFAAQKEAKHENVKLSTSNYCLIGVDLGDLVSLKHLWTTPTACSVVKELPTLVLSECVMTYMDDKLSSNLIRFCHDFFSRCLFVTYEQVEPYDAFGQFMRSHFDKLNSSLKGICVYDNKLKQVQRYKSCGFSEVSFVDFSVHLE